MSLDVLDDRIMDDAESESRVLVDDDLSGVVEQEEILFLGDTDLKLPEADQELRLELEDDRLMALFGDGLCSIDFGGDVLRDVGGDIELARSRERIDPQGDIGE